MTDLTSVVVGGFIALGTGLVGLAVGQFLEHTRWLKDKRLDAYARFLRTADHLSVLGRTDTGDIDQAVKDKFTEESTGAIALVKLVGPDVVYDAAEEFRVALNDSMQFRGLLEEREEARLKARLKFIGAARDHAKLN